MREGISHNLIMEYVNTGSLALYRCKQCFPRKGTRFARAIIGVNVQKNAVVHRQLWGTAFPPSNLHREDLNSIAHQVAQVETDEEVKRRTWLFGGQPEWSFPNCNDTPNDKSAMEGFSALSECQCHCTSTL